MRKLDWESRHDEESRNFDIRKVVTRPGVKSRGWLEGQVLDQGNEGACVGFGWTAALLSRPDRWTPTPSEGHGNYFAREIYYQAQMVDEWAGENYEGTSVLAGAKILAARNLIQSYWWAFDTEAVRDTVVWASPVVIGIPWYDGMYDTAPSGLVDVSGSLVGGHCITLTGYSPKAVIDGKRREVFRWRNSWGEEYGRKGSGYIEISDLDWLLSQNGEACVPVGKKPPVI